LDNESESNLDLSLEKSFSNNLKAKETNFPNSSISPSYTINSSTQKTQQFQPKAASDLDKILNTNINNLNSLSNYNNHNIKENINSNLTSSNMNVNLRSFQQNPLNNPSQFGTNNIGNFTNKNLGIINEQHMENESEFPESLESKVNKYNLSMNDNNIRSKSITNPSYFMNGNEKLLEVNADKTIQNRLEILVKNNKIDTNLDSISNRLSAMGTASMKIDEILAKNTNNPNINFNNLIVSNKEFVGNTGTPSAYTGKDSNLVIDMNSRISSYPNNVNFEAPQKPAFLNPVFDANPNKETTIANNAASASGSSLDDIFKKYGIKIDENTAGVLPLNNNNIIIDVGKKKEAENESKANNLINHSSLADNSNKNINSDLHSNRKSVEKLKETDLVSLQRELSEKDNLLNKKKDENMFDELKKEDLNRLIENKKQSPAFENIVANRDSFSSKVQKILESGEKINTNNDNLYSNNSNNNFNLVDDQRRNTSFQLQSNSNKTFTFNLDKDQNSTFDNSKINETRLINHNESLGIRNTAFHPASNIYLNDKSANDSEDLESKNKDKLKRNSSIFMKRAKVQTQEIEDLKPNSNINTLEATRKSTYQEKLISTYINDLQGEEEEKRRNTNLQPQNTFNLNSINFNSSTSNITVTNKEIISDENFNSKNKININGTEDIESNIALQNSTDFRNNKRNINIIIEDTNDKQNEFVPPDTAKGKRVSGLMKRPNARDLKPEEKSDEENHTEKDPEKSQLATKENFIKKLNTNILKRGNYKDHDDTESIDDHKLKHKFSKKNSEERSQNTEEENEDEEEVEIQSNSSGLEEMEEENEDSDVDQIMELDEEYESEEISVEDNHANNKKAAGQEALDDIYLNHILKFTEKEIKKNKELTEENSRKNSAITVFII